MKINLIFLTWLVLLATTMTSHAQRASSESWGGFSLNQLENLSNGVFEQLDTDQNGSITLEEIDLLRTESVERLDEEELVLRQRRLSLINRYFWSAEEFDAFEVGDTNADGSMNRDEYDNLESNVRTHVLKLGLQSLDKDKNGSVETNEFSAHLDSFEEWDTDGNGIIDRTELREISNQRFLTDIRRRWTSRENLGEEELRRIVAERERRAAELQRRAGSDKTED